MTALVQPAFLRNALFLDAAASGAMALLLVAGAGPLSGLLGLDTTFLRIAGLVLVPFTALVVWTSRSAGPDRSAVRTIVGCNIAWVVASVLFLVSGAVDPTGLGYAFVIVQAVAVAVFADLQIVGLRRAG